MSDQLTVYGRAGGTVALRVVPFGGFKTGYVFSTEADRTTGVYIDSTRMREMAQWLNDAADHLDYTPLREAP